jgi:TolB protein
MELYPGWSADSRKLVFSSDRDGNLELYMLDLETQHTERLTFHPGSDIEPAWRP